MIRDAYVYAIFVDGVVRYIGKGCKKRIYHHVRRAHVITSNRANGQKLRTTHFYRRMVEAVERGATIEEVFLVRDLSHAEAFAIERERIADVGRDQLWNTLDDARRRYESPEYRAKHKAALNTPAARANRSAASKAQWADPAVRAKKLEALKRSWEGHDARRKKAAAQTAARYGSASARAAHSKRMTDACSTPESRAKKSAAVQKFVNDPVYREKLRAGIRAYRASQRASV